MNLASDQDCHLWEGTVDTSSFPYLDDHRVQGTAVLPATAYIEMAFSAAAEVYGEGAFRVSAVDYQKPIIFSDGASITTQVSLRPGEAGGVRFEIFSRPSTVQAGGGWTRNVHGTLHFGDEVGHPSTIDLAAVRERCTEHVDGATFYRRLAERGNQWGTAFQGVAALWRGEREALSLVRVSESLLPEIGHYQFHPAVSDACGHVLVATLPLDHSGGHGGAFVGGSIDEARLYRRPHGTSLWAYARLRPDEDERANVLVGDVQVFDEDGEIVSETMGARLWYLDEHEQRAVDPGNWIYTLDWEPQAAPASVPATNPSLPWIILADAGGVGEALADELQQRGSRCVLAYAGMAYARTANDRYALEPGSSASFARFLSDTLGEDGAQGIIHLWGLDTPLAAELGTVELEAGQQIGLITALHLVQALATAPLRRHPRIWLVTRAAQAAGGVVVDPAQAPVWGMARALALEHSEFWGGLIDLGPDDQPATAGISLATELMASTEDQVALRGESRFVARLSHPDLVPSFGQIAMRPDASYLITGGLGGLGLRLARRLAGRGARYLILLGRTSLPPRADWENLESTCRAAGQVAAVRALEEMGVTIHIAAVDVADEPALREALDAASRAGLPHIAGVFHAAGTIAHSTLASLDAEALRTELNAKLVGGWALHRVFSGTPIEHFVLFSSASALLSSPRLGAYAAANAFLDALAHHRHNLGLPALSINWGLWGEVGMAAQFDSDDVAMLALRGMGVIAPEQGLDVLERLLQSDLAQAAVLPVDWARWRQRYPAFTRAPLLARLMAGADDALAQSEPTLSATALERVSPDERSGLVEAYLAEQVARVLGMEVAELDHAVPLSSIGIDSLMAVEVKNRVELDLGVVIPMVQLLQGPSVTLLANHVLDLFSACSSGSVAEPALSPVDELAEVEHLLAQLDQLSDEQVESLLAGIATEKEVADD
jgi:myxalamid-type polyketide synthase MxaE and MxaD